MYKFAVRHKRGAATLRSAAEIIPWNLMRSVPPKGLAADPCLRNDSPQFCSSCRLALTTGSAAVRVCFRKNLAYNGYRDQRQACGGQRAVNMFTYRVAVGQRCIFFLRHNSLSVFIYKILFLLVSFQKLTQCKFKLFLLNTRGLKHICLQIFFPIDRTKKDGRSTLPAFIIQ